MQIRESHPWPATAAEARAIQDRLRPLADLTGPGPAAPATVAGVDVAYDEESDRLAAAAVVLDYRTMQVADQAVAVGRAAFDYVPGLFAFRELPALLDALRGLRVDPDLLACDGQGIAHPRRFGLACHLGVLTGLPAIGVAKTPLTGTFDEPAAERGAWTPMRDGPDIVGRALRTRTGVKPVYVSVGHRVTLDDACRYALHLTPAYRLPETTRHADRLARRSLR